MVGLFCMMAMCGLFVPAKRAVLSVFDEIYCDVGDAQSIEESLSTFSSHITNIIRIVENASEKSLVLIDELGGGTDPDEGQALAKAIVSHLLSIGCTGVVTTHYTALKEFAFSAEGIQNACMEFDSNTLQPLYVIRIGLPGSSNALAISRRLGLSESILQNAMNNLSTDAQRFENIVRSAEESRIEAETVLAESNRLKAEWNEKLAALEIEREKLQKEKDKLYASAKTEARRIINERSSQAEELLAEIEEIFAKESISQADLIKARTLKNKLADKAFETDGENVLRPQYKKVTAADIRVGVSVYLKNLNQQGVIQSVREQKQEAEVLCGNIRVRSKFSDIFVVIGNETAQTVPKKKVWQKRGELEKVQITKSLAPKPIPSLEVNVIGMTVQEALPDVASLIDGAVISNLDEVRIVHGVGTGKLRAGIHEFLRKHKNVESYRLGKYGEGETGVTIVTIK
jgi:DNA mismatch repair protein MutS2